MRLEDWPNTTQWMGGRWFRNHSPYLCLRGERYKRLPKKQVNGQPAGICPRRASLQMPYFHTSLQSSKWAPTATSNQPQVWASPGFAVHRPLRTSGFFFLLCKIERDDSSYCALNAGVTQPSFPTVSYSAVPPSLPTSAHRCQEIACYRVRLISGQTALLLSHRHTQVVLCPLLHRLSHRTPKVVNILTEKLSNQTGLFQFSGALIIKDAAEDRD